MEQVITNWIMQHGAAALFGLLVLGIVGLPVPNETLLTVAGALVRRGELQFLPTLVAAVTGTLAGVTVSYGIGRFVGVAFLIRYGHILHVGPAMLDRAHRWFARVGKWTLTFGYFIPGVRHVTAIAAGSAELELPVFALFAYTGAFVWSILFLAVGYYLGDRWANLIEAVRHHSRLLTFTAVALVGGYALFRALKSKSVA